MIQRTLCLGLLAALSAPVAQAAMPLDEALESKPVLATLLGSEARLVDASDALGLNERQAVALEQVVVAEKLAVNALFQQALDAAEDLSPGREQRVEAYNLAVLDLAQKQRALLEQSLGEVGFDRFMDWAEPLWIADSQRGGAQRASPEALTYEVFCTQYNAYTTYEVAVPDKYVKFAAQGTQYASGYPASGDYRVTLNRGTGPYTVRVYEVGPWNIDDNYWNAANDPNRPRRMFTDLPKGKPEAQAAYYDGYNGGKDQYNRTVLNPGGCDLSIQVAADVGLAYLENDWINVTYLWESGTSTSTGNLKGFVREGDIYNGPAIAGARVTLSSGSSTTTDSSGLYTFSGVSTGAVTVTANAQCYYPSSLTKTVEGGIDNWASMALTVDPTCGGGGGGGCAAAGLSGLDAATGGAPALLLITGMWIRRRRRARR